MTIMDEHSPISHIVWNDKEESFLKAGCDGIGKIVPYQENGELSYVTWLRVVNEDGTTFARLPAHQVSIFY